MATSVRGSLMAVASSQKIDMCFVKKRCRICSMLCQNGLYMGLFTTDNQKRHKTVSALHEKKSMLITCKLVYTSIQIMHLKVRLASKSRKAE